MKRYTYVRRRDKFIIFELPTWETIGVHNDEETAKALVSIFNGGVSVYDILYAGNVLK